MQIKVFLWLEIWHKKTPDNLNNGFEIVDAPPKQCIGANQNENQRN